MRCSEQCSHTTCTAVAERTLLSVLYEAYSTHRTRMLQCRVPELQTIVPHSLVSCKEKNTCKEMFHQVLLIHIHFCVCSTNSASNGDLIGQLHVV